MDLATIYCPDLGCSKHGQPGLGKHITLYGYDNGRHKLKCAVCDRYFSERVGTAYFGLREEERIFTIATTALAEGNSLRGTSRIVGVDKDTVCRWLSRASDHCTRVGGHLWRNLPLRECQLDELWSFVHKKEKNLTPIEQILNEYGDAWVWVAFEPILKIIPAFVVGKRVQENANLLIAQTAAVSDGHIPFFTSDDLPHYATALLAQYGVLETVVRRPGQRGPLRQPRHLPPPDLLYAIVVKRREKGRVVEVSQRVVFGSEAQVRACLAASPVSQHINTSHVERDNLTMRQGSQRLTRKTLGFSKELPWLERQLRLAFTYYHFVLPHEGLKRPLDPAIPTKGAHGSPKRWQPCTPAMAAGVTDHVWTMEELLSYRVPPKQPT
jgi:IS1 family transposase